MRGIKEKRVADIGNYISAGTKIILVDGENSDEILTAPENRSIGSTFCAIKISNNIDMDFFNISFQSKNVSQ